MGKRLIQRFPAGSRSGLIIGVDKPGPTNTGILPGVSLTTSSGNITVTSPNVTLENLDIFGKVTIQAANCIIRNCRIRGLNSSPGSSDAFLVSCTSGSCVNALIEDCTFVPDYPHWNWDSGVSGHDYTIRRCDISGVVDGLNVYNTSASQPYASNVIIDQNWIHDLGQWSAATGGVVHPSDTVTHNDGIQHQGGYGTLMRGNTIDAYYKRQYGHWVVTNPGTEPYVTVTLNSLPDGGPYATIPDRGTGNSASGRYNWGNLSALMLNQNVGDSYDLTFTDNWVNGASIPVNGGSLTRHTGQNLGTFYRNKFSRDQGQQSSGGNNTYTFNLDTTWVGNVSGGVGTGNANIYLSDGAEVNFRVNA